MPIWWRREDFRFHAKPQKGKGALSLGTILYSFDRFFYWKNLLNAKFAEDAKRPQSLRAKFPSFSTVALLGNVQYSTLNAQFSLNILNVILRYKLKTGCAVGCVRDGSGKPTANGSSI
jgi:hypothetical protein